MRGVVDRNVVMRRIHVHITAILSLHLLIRTLYVSKADLAIRISR